MPETLVNASSGGGGGGGGKKPGRGGRKIFLDQHRSLKLFSTSGQSAGGDTGGAAGGGPPDLPEGIIALPDGTYYCRLCNRYGLRSMEAVRAHCSSDKHMAALLLQKRKSVADKIQKVIIPKGQQTPRLRIESSGIFDAKKNEHTMSVKLGEKNEALLTLTFTATNISANSVFRFKDWGCSASSKEFELINPPADDCLLGPNQQVKLHMRMTPEQEYVHAFSVAFHFVDTTRGGTVTAASCDVKISFVSSTTADLSATGGYYNARDARPRAKQYYKRGTAVPGMPLPTLNDRYKLERDRQLPYYDMSKHVHQFINDGLVFKSDFTAVETDELTVFKKALDEEAVTFTNYQSRFSALLYLEEHQTTVDMETYFMERVRLQRHGQSNLLSLEVPGLAENRPSVLRGDQLFVREYLGPDKYDNKEYQGFVHDVQQTRVFLGFNKKLVDKHHAGMEFCVRFVNNRLPMRVQHRGLSLVEPDESNLEDALFPTEDTARTQGFLLAADTTFRFFSREPELNPEQARAVRYIVLGSSRPAPYIVFGPPGTGKTFTIVEAIKQVLKNIPDARVLACAPSNSATDLITEKLLGHVQKRQMYRLNAFSRPLGSIPPSIKGVCNVDETGEICFPSKEELERRGVRVYATTLITAGRLVSAQFDPDHFTHIFIDEASQATEPESVAALAGLLYISRQSAGKQIVIAGDPMQLGPILRSPFAKKFKLDVSLMERLMERPIYRRRDQPGPQDGLYYDPLLITKLVRNYRSHPAILDVPNRLFYNGELVASGIPELTHRMCGWEQLPNREVPVLFQAVVGEDMQEKSSPSFFNPYEVTQVMKFVDLLVNQKSPKGVKIKEDHIGIITPYSKQVQKIRGEVRKRGLQNLKVGSVEEFQGQERLIIIVSTVRSNPRFLTTDNKFGIGFLQNDKRFNVAVTRAKALLIVIGNPNIVRHNKSWNSFVEFCKGNNCMVDGHLDRSDEDTTFRKLRQMLEDLDMNMDGPDSGELTTQDLDQISAFNNEQASIYRRDQ